MPVVIFACTLDAHAFESLLPFATTLARRGCRVLFLAEPSFRARAEAAGLEFVRMSDLDDEEDVDVAGLPRRTDVARRLLAFERTIRRHHVDRLTAQHRSLQSLLARIAAQHPDGPAPVLVHDTMFLGAWPLLLGAAGHRPAATLSIGVMPPPLSDEFTAPFGLALPPDGSDAGRRLNAAMNAQLHELFAGTQAALDRALRRCGATRPPPFVLDGVVSLPDRVLQLSVAQLEYARGNALPTLSYIGLAPAGAGAAALPAWWSDLDTARPVVLVAAGRLAGGDLDPLVRSTLYALRNEPVLIVVAVDWNARRFGPLPVNARSAPELPLEALLARVDVVVSHGAYADTQRALSHGVPVIMAPQSESERELAARVVRAGAGVQLTTAYSVEEILVAVQAVLETMAFLVAARRLRDAYLRHDAVEAVVAAVLAHATPPRP